jgi:hypothetical protein
MTPINGETDDLQPARRGRPGERVAHQVGIERHVAGERLDGGQRRGRVLRLVGAVQRQEDVVVLRTQPLQRQQLAADRRDPREHAELKAFTDRRRPDLRAAPQQHLGRTGELLGEHGRGAGLDDPGLLDRDHVRGVAEQPGMVDGDGGHHRDGAVGDVGGVPGAAETDLDDGDVDGRVGEGGIRHPDDRLEEAQRVGLGGVDEVGVRRDVVERADELLVGQWLAVDADALVDALEVGTGEPAGAQVERAQEGVDHPAGRGLAVGAGEVDDRVGPLGVAEQLGERLDALERRLEPGLGPSGLEGVRDLREGLGETRLGLLAHVEPESRDPHSTRRFAMSTTRR